MKHRLLFALCALTLGAWLLPSWAAPAGAATTIVKARTTASVTLANAGGAYTKVETLSLAAGSWTITSDLTAVNFGPGDFVRCRLQAKGSIIDGGATVFLANRISGVTNVGTVTTSDTESVSVVCGHDHPDASAGQFYVDAGATMIALSGGPIAGPGVAATSKTAVAQARTSASVNLPLGTFTAVVTRSLPAGTWTITGNLTAVDLARGSSGLAECKLTSSAGTTVSALSTFSGVGGADDVAARVDLEDVATVPDGGGTVSISCKSDASVSAYVDPGATVTATKTPPSHEVDATDAGVALNPQAGSQTVIKTIGMDAGTWRVRSVVDIGYLDVGDTFRCTLRANGVPIDGGATQEIPPDSKVDPVVDTGTFTAKAGWTLAVACSHDQDTASGNWTVESGHIVAVNTAAK